MCRRVLTSRCASRARADAPSLTAGHEIRNPLHGVGAGVEACLSGDMTLAEIRTELAAVLDGVRMIATITNDLLDLQKMRAGGFSVNLAAASPAALVEACVRLVQPAVIVPIAVEVDASVPPLVRGGARSCPGLTLYGCRTHLIHRVCSGTFLSQVLTDATRVRQIVTNGLTNAIKYSNAAANGAIRVLLHTGATRESRDTAGVTLDQSTSAAAPPPAYLFIDLLDRGPGLRGTTEAVLFQDFFAPITHPHEVIQQSSRNLVHVGSSGVGLPVCARSVKPAAPLLCSCAFQSGGCSLRVRHVSQRCCLIVYICIHQA